MNWKEYSKQWELPFVEDSKMDNSFLLEEQYFLKYWSKEKDARRVGALICEHLEMLETRNCFIKLHNQSVEYLMDVLAGFYLKHFKFSKYKSQKDVIELKIFSSDAVDLNERWNELRFSLESVLWAREICSTPANHMSPQDFCERVTEELTPLGYRVEVMENEDLKEMELLLSVALGNPNRKPRVLKICKGTPQLSIIGKGVTFDTGGISVKPALDMHKMVGDKGGAVAVVAAARSLHSKVENVLFLCGMVENSVDAEAQRPGDIWRSLSGKTVEVLNTDAEGRLVLADLVYYAASQGCQKIVTIATLTGAVSVALGSQHAGFFTNSSRLKELLSDASRKSKESGWFLPLDEEYKKSLLSDKADLQNISNTGSAAAASMGAKFIEQFSFRKNLEQEESVDFAHIDIAGVTAKRNLSSTPFNGFGTHLLEQLCILWYANP